MECGDGAKCITECLRDIREGRETKCRYDAPCEECGANCEENDE